MSEPEQEIEQLKELVRQNIALTQENNRIIRGMRNAGRMRTMVWLFFVGLSIGGSVWAYYTFVAPKIAQLTSLYGDNASQAQTIWQGANDFFKGISGQGSTTQ